MEVHQVLPTLAAGDAIGEECLHVQRILRKAGFESRIFAENIEPSLAYDAEPYTGLKPSPEDLVLFHYSIGSEITDFVKRLSCHKILWYHNVTPYHFFKGYNEELSKLCKKGRDDLRSLAPYFPSSFADSEYNRDDLMAMGFKDVRIVPVTLDFSRLSRVKPDPSLMRALEGDINVLFVGRFAPHKGQLELIKIFSYFKKHVCPTARLFLVGSYEGMEKYRDEALALIRTLGVGDVHIAGKVSAPALAAYYRSASIFLCASEHEGFCVPLVEAMCHRIPILAYRRAAVPYTLGGSGILFSSKDHFEIAEMMGQIIENRALRERLLERQDVRSKAFMDSGDSLLSTLGGINHA